MEKGATLHDAFRCFAWYLRGKSYRSDAARAIRLSEKSLIRLFYVWRDNGRNPEALALKYRPGKVSMKGGEVRRFIRAALAGGDSYLAARNRLNEPKGTAAAYRHAIGGNARSALGGLFAARRRAKWAEKLAKRKLAGRAG